MGVSVEPMVPCAGCLKGATNLNDIHLFPLYLCYKAVLESPSASTLLCPRVSSHLEGDGTLLFFMNEECYIKLTEQYWPEPMKVSTLLPSVPFLVHVEAGAIHSGLLGVGCLPTFKVCGASFSSLLFMHGFLPCDTSLSLPLVTHG